MRKKNTTITQWGIKPVGCTGVLVGKNPVSKKDKTPNRQLPDHKMPEWDIKKELESFFNRKDNKWFNQMEAIYSTKWRDKRWRVASTCPKSVSVLWISALLWHLFNSWLGFCLKKQIFFKNQKVLLLFPICRQWTGYFAISLPMWAKCKFSMTAIFYKLS